MGIIKSPNVPVTISPFSMADVEHAAKSVLLRARQQADELLAVAQTEGEKLKVEAIAQGHAGGYREGLTQGLAEGRNTGRQEAMSEYKAELAQALTALNDAATTLNA